MRITLLSLLIVCSTFAFGQKEFSEGQVQKLILEHNLDGLLDEDVQDLVIESQYVNEQTGIAYIYVNQTYNNIPIFNVKATIAIPKEGRPVVNSRFIPSLQELKVSSNSPSLDQETAVREAFGYGGIDKSTLIEKAQVRSTTDYTLYTSESLTDHGAKVRPTYVLKDNELVLTWDVSYFPKRGTDYWSMRVNASDGELVDQSSFTVHCKFDAPGHKHSDEHCNVVKKAPYFAASLFADSAIYNVLPLPVESPIHGDRAILVDPSDSIASPFGWHDLNGLDGNETTITEGNNVNAWVDLDGNISPDFDVDGGNDLIFDYPYDGTLEPAGYSEAAAINLFYMNNMMHDFTYAYGLTEVSGNFQANNYGKGGLGDDPVIALAQFDGNGSANLNNATFSTPDDGGNGTMRMFLWDTRNDISVFNVLAPQEIAGPYESRTAAFGQEIDTVAFEGEVAIADDGVGNGTDACEDIQNGDEIAGKIALIDRGDCEFGFKILNAEQRGAIGAIICNNVPGILGGQMGAGAVGNQVTIPSVFLSQADCERIRVFAGSGLTVRFQVPPDNGQPDRVDGSFDNGIIAHEYGHGVSNRLTAGPLASNCLRGFTIDGREEGEQMGEGWSDYFSLVLTVEEGDTPDDPRGIGNYALRNMADGTGIREYPYSRDMTINPVTYYDTYEASIPHGVGHVWCSMLWDMYWNFVDRYGWDADFIHGTGGNNKAILLVMEGMRLQPCNPGFVDGRDAILQADQLLCGGENQDIIWESFARRGLGWMASQGESSLVADGREDYRVPPQFVNSVKLSKEMTPNIEKGEDIEVDLIVRNDTDETADNIEIIDMIPAGTDVVMSSLPAGAQVDGDQITFVIPSLEAGESMTISFVLSTPLTPSRLISFDDMEAPDTDGGRWFAQSITGNDNFDLVTNDALSGTNSWKLQDMGDGQEQTLFSFYDIAVTGTQPIVRFSHKHAIDDGNDGGSFELSTDFFGTSDDMGEHMFRNGYNNRIRNNAFPDGREEAFTGDSEGWFDTYVDLADYNNTSPLFLFRYASDNNVDSDFWVIDDVVVFDALSYNSEACMTYDGGSAPICAEAIEWGTIVEPEEFSSTEETTNDGAKITVYPNPVREMITIDLGEEAQGELVIRDVNGRLMNATNIDRNNQFALDVRDWAAGIYIVEFLTANERITKRFIKK